MDGILSKCKELVFDCAQNGLRWHCWTFLWISKIKLKNGKLTTERITLGISWW